MIRIGPISRRGLLGASSAALLGASCAALLGREALADVDPHWRPRGLDLRELDTGGPAARRFVLAVPRDVAEGERLPLVVLLHGLGETNRERDGAWAWLERYGLGTSYDRLVEAGTPVRLAFVCPFMPLLAGAREVEAYGRWIRGDLLARARAEGHALGAGTMATTAAATAIGGCSLGGRVSLEVFLQDPSAFGAWAGVQTAIDSAAGARFGERLADATRHLGGRDLFVETSSGDPFREGNAALAGALARRGVARTFVELPGPHDQPWLRRSGTPRLVAWLSARTAS